MPSCLRSAANPSFSPRTTCVPASVRHHDCCHMLSFDTRDAFRAASRRVSSCLRYPSRCAVLPPSVPCPHSSRPPVASRALCSSLVFIAIALRFSTVYSLAITSSACSCAIVCWFRGSLFATDSFRYTILRPFLHRHVFTMSSAVVADTFPLTYPAVVRGSIPCDASVLVSRSLSFCSSVDRSHSHARVFVRISPAVFALRARFTVHLARLDLSAVRPVFGLPVPLHPFWLDLGETASSTCVRPHTTAPATLRNRTPTAPVGPASPLTPPDDSRDLRIVRRAFRAALSRLPLAPLCPRPRWMRTPPDAPSVSATGETARHRLSSSTTTFRRKSLSTSRLPIRLWRQSSSLRRMRLTTNCLAVPSRTLTGTSSNPTWTTVARRTLATDALSRVSPILPSSTHETPWPMRESSLRTTHRDTATDVSPRAVSTC